MLWDREHGLFSAPHVHSSPVCAWEHWLHVCTQVSCTCAWSWMPWGCCGSYILGPSCFVLKVKMSVNFMLCSGFTKLLNWHGNYEGFFENQTFLMTQWFVTANDCFSLHPGGCGLKSTSVWLCWGLWFMLMAEQFKVNRSNLESDLPLRGGTLNRVLVKPRFLEHGFWQM